MYVAGNSLCCAKWNALEIRYGIFSGRPGLTGAYGSYEVYVCDSNDYGCGVTVDEW